MFRRKEKEQRPAQETVEYWKNMSDSNHNLWLSGYEERQRLEEEINRLKAELREVRAEYLGFQRATIAGGAVLQPQKEDATE